MPAGFVYISSIQSYIYELMIFLSLSLFIWKMCVKFAESLFVTLPYN